MRVALAHHDAMSRAAVESHHGIVVKTTGDGIYAAFDEPVGALEAALQVQNAVADASTTGGIALRVRCGLHAGPVERRDGDFFGSTVNRAARIMGAAHGGQVLLSQAVAVLVRDHLPAHVALRDLGLVRLRDLASPEHVYQLAHPRLRENFPALRSLEAIPNNLPQQVTSFVGRAPELATVKALLDGTRLLTLLGVGGIGKTRLSLQVAADVIDAYPDGVWFVEARAAHGRTARAAGGGVGPRGQGGTGSSGARGAGRTCAAATGAASPPGQLRTPGARVRGAGRAVAAIGTPAPEAPRNEPRAAARGRRDDATPCRRSRCPTRKTTVDHACHARPER